MKKHPEAHCGIAGNGLIGLTSISIAIWLFALPGFAGAATPSLEDVVFVENGKDVEIHLKSNGSPLTQRVYFNNNRLMIRMRRTALGRAEGALENIPHPFSSGKLLVKNGSVLISLKADRPGKNLFRIMKQKTLVEGSVLVFPGVGLGNSPANELKPDKNKDQLAALINVLDGGDKKEPVKREETLTGSEESVVAAKEIPETKTESEPSNKSLIIKELMADQGAIASTGTDLLSETASVESWSNTRWISIMAVLSILFAIVHYLKKRRGLLNFSAHKSDVRVISNTQIAMKSRLVLIEVEGEKMLVGVGENGVRLVHHFGDEGNSSEDDKWQSQLLEQENPAPVKSKIDHVASELKPHRKETMEDFISLLSPRKSTKSATQVKTRNVYTKNDFSNAQNVSRGNFDLAALLGGK